MQNCTIVAVSVLSSLFTFGLQGPYERDPPRRAVASCFTLTRAGQHAVSDIKRTVILIGLRGDLHLLDDELQEAMLLLQDA